MTKMMRFDTEQSRYMGMEIPVHTQEALENYFMHGFSPGGFLTAVLVGDLYRAVNTADTANRRMLWAISHWVMVSAPDGSWGSYELVEDWCADKNGRRTAYVTEVEKDHIIQVLSTP